MDLVNVDHIRPFRIDIYIVHGPYEIYIWITQKIKAANHITALP